MLEFNSYITFIYVYPIMNNLPDVILLFDVLHSEVLTALSYLHRVWCLVSRIVASILYLP